MANGRTHARYAGNFLFLASAGALGLTQTPGYREEAIALVLGAVGGWLVTPDIDITGRTYEQRRALHSPRTALRDHLSGW